MHLFGVNMIWNLLACDMQVSRTYDTQLPHNPKPAHHVAYSKVNFCVFICRTIYYTHFNEIRLHENAKQHMCWGANMNMHQISASSWPVLCIHVVHLKSFKARVAIDYPLHIPKEFIRSLLKMTDKNYFRRKQHICDRTCVLGFAERRENNRCRRIAHSILFSVSLVVETLDYITKQMIQSNMFITVSLASVCGLLWT